MAEGSPLKDGRYLWLLVPAFAWGGIVARILLPFPAPYISFGAYGCVLGSITIAVLALRKKKKDIVSICVPIFAFIIFNPTADVPDFLIELLYAATLTALVIRLEKRFH